MVFRSNFYTNRLKSQLSFPRIVDDYPAHLELWYREYGTKFRDRSRAASTSKMERVVIIVNGFQPLTIITKRSILDVAAALDPPLKFFL